MDRIKNWFRSLGSKAQSFMYGRYGFDELSQFLSKAALFCVIVGLFAYPAFFCSLAMVLYLLCMTAVILILGAELNAALKTVRESAAGFDQ